MSEPSEPGADSESDRKKRMESLIPLVLPQKGTEARKAYEARFNEVWRNPEAKSRIKQMHQTAMATVKAQQASGAGYLSDQALRELQREYTHRLITYGASYLPTSFNIAEAFFQTGQKVAGFFLLPESDYLISFSDFLDFVTAPDTPAVDIGAARSLPENCIINVNSLDLLGDLLLNTDSGHSFAIAGASYVRRGNELSILMVVGERFSENDKTDLDPKRLSEESVLVLPHKRDMAADPIDRGEIVYLDQEQELVRDLALCRFNLEVGQLEGRVLMQDVGVSYVIRTDLVETLAPMTAIGGDPEGSADLMAGHLDEVSAVWECAKTLVLLPAYLAARVSVKREERRSTSLGIQIRNSLKVQKATAKALPDAKVLFRTISAIRVERPTPSSSVVGRSYTPPQFQVAVSGFWRTFSDPDQVGRDGEGRPVKGKTWVKGHVRHKDKSGSPGPKVVYIKASLAQARRKMASYRALQEVAAPAAPVTSARVATTTSTQAQSLSAANLSTASDPSVAAHASTGEPAYIYVMRSPSHGRDIYKVGYTDRDPEVRARELSSTTAAPVAFLVVQAWAVINGLAAERAAHDALTMYRLSSNREFFQATYASLRERIEAAIEPWEIR